MTQKLISDIKPNDLVEVIFELESGVQYILRGDAARKLAFLAAVEGLTGTIVHPIAFLDE